MNSDDWEDMHKDWYRCSLFGDVKYLCNNCNHWPMDQLPDEFHWGLIVYEDGREEVVTA